MRKMVILCSIFALCVTKAYPQRREMVKILVTSPHIPDKVYRPVADVFAGCIIRELNRKGGIEILDREKSEAYLREKGLPEWAVDNRTLAVEVGNAMGADIILYSIISRNYGSFTYSLGFLEVKADLIQRILNGSFSETASPSEIGRLVNAEMKKLVNYIPLPSEIDNRGLVLREETVNPDNLPPSVSIDPRWTGSGVWNRCSPIIGCSPASWNT